MKHSTSFIAALLGITLSIVSGTALSTAALAATPCCTRIIVPTGQEYRIEYQTVSEPVTQTAYKKVVETNYVEEEITTYETVWETEQRERRYTVAKQVPETSTRQRRYTVTKPVEETVMKDTSYNVTRLVPETTEREERYLVSKQVFETQQREVIETRKVPVQETTLQERAYTVSKPVTTFVEQTVDRGGYVDQVNVKPGKTYHRLAWQRAGEYYDSTTGTTRRHWPGFFWTPMQGPERHEVSKVYRPNYVSETVPVTNFVHEQRIEQIPVTRTTFQEEKIARIEEVQVPRTVQEEVVRKIPVTTYKQVVERVEQQTPVKVQRLVTEERVEEVPVTTYKTVMEERVEPYEVKVAKVVPVKKTVRKPVTVEKWVPYTYMLEKKRTVVNRIPIVSSTEVIVESPGYATTTQIASPISSTLSPTKIGMPKTDTTGLSDAPGYARSGGSADGNTVATPAKDAADEVPVL